MSKIVDPYVGHIVLVNKTDLTKVMCHPDRLDRFPATDWTPIGVVVVPPTHEVYGKYTIGVMSIVNMDCDNPTEGNIRMKPMSWGPYGSGVPLPVMHECPICDLESGEVYTKENIGYMNMDAVEITKCRYDENTFYYWTYEDIDGSAAPSPYDNDGNRNPAYYMTDEPSSKCNCLSDFDGRGNTNMILKTRGKRNYTGWKPQAAESYDFAAASCCDLFCTIGTKQGDWYLPAMGELGYVIARIDVINHAIRKCIKAYGMHVGSELVPERYWSSTQHSDHDARVIDLETGGVTITYKSCINAHTRAWTQIKGTDIFIDTELDDYV